MDLAGINSQIAGRIADMQAGKGAGALRGVGGIGGIGDIGGSEAAGASGAGLDFASTLSSALQSVSKSQADATELQKQFQLENPNVSLEQTMVAMNTSALNFSAAVQVRNKLVQAYDSIMNMQV
jgi:flagellar hook-basal body complex protein FliE